MEELILSGTRALTQIDRIVNALSLIIYEIFRGNGYGSMLVNTILDNNFLLISLSLVIIGFVIGIIKRLISL